MTSARKRSGGAPTSTSSPDRFTTRRTAPPLRGGVWVPTECCDALLARQQRHDDLEAREASFARTRPRQPAPMSIYPACLRTGGNGRGEVQGDQGARVVRQSRDGAQSWVPRRRSSSHSLEQVNSQTKSSSQSDTYISRGLHRVRSRGTHSAVSGQLRCSRPGAGGVCRFSNAAAEPRGSNAPVSSIQFFEWSGNGTRRS